MRRRRDYGRAAIHIFFVMPLVGAGIGLLIVAGLAARGVTP